MLRWLTSKGIARHPVVEKKAAEIFQPLQFGIGVRGGCEAIIHAAWSTLYDSHLTSEERVLLQLDLDNAYNHADRSCLFEEVHKHFPELSAWAEASYGSLAQLQFSDLIIYSCVGVHQGDPLASLFFALLLLPILTNISQQVPNLELNVWLHDNGALIGKAQDLLAAVNIFHQQGPARGLFFSTSKSVVWSPVIHVRNLHFPLTNQGLQLSSEQGTVLLGAPIASTDYEEAAFEVQINQIELILNKLPSRSDPHCEFVLLCSCFAIPKLSYTLHTLDTTNHTSLMDRFDCLIRSALEDILSSPLTVPTCFCACVYGWPMTQAGLQTCSCILYSLIEFLIPNYWHALPR